MAAGPRHRRAVALARGGWRPPSAAAGRGTARADAASTASAAGPRPAWPSARAAGPLCPRPTHALAALGPAATRPVASCCSHAGRGAEVSQCLHAWGRAGSAGCTRGHGGASSLARRLSPHPQHALPRPPTARAAPVGQAFGIHPVCCPGVCSIAGLSLPCSLSPPCSLSLPARPR